MEQQLLTKCLDSLSPQTTTATTAASFCLARTLITNPSTSDQTLTSLVETLILSLNHHHNIHALSLLSEISSLRPHLSHHISTNLHSYCLLPDSPLPNLALALSTTELDHNLTETLFLSLIFRPSISVRQSLLINAERYHIRPSLLLTIFLGFTKDPYPFIRSAALDGLVKLCKCLVIQDRGIIEGCYCRAVELLFDSEDFVRCSALHAVSEWGQLLVKSSEDRNKGDLSDALFVQLCLMVRDMDVKVRVAAFDNLAKVAVVSEDILSQTLSKKVLPIMKEKKYSGQFSTKVFEIPASSVAGAFIHGLEDEFHEVRRSACSCLFTLVILSVDFAARALNLLVDVLNDDSLSVRLQALETMHHVTVFSQPKVQEVHMHMLLRTLGDSSTSVRSAVRKLLRITKLHNLTLFRLSVDNLIQNLEMYPQDEADVFSVLLNIGRCHGKFAVSIIKEVFSEIDPFSGGFDSAKTAAWLVLAISAPLSLLKERQLRSVPPVLFSYAVTILGRISRGLADVLEQNTLLAYLSNCSEATAVSSSELTEEQLPAAEGDLPNDISSHIASLLELDVDSHGVSENLLHGFSEQSTSAVLKLDNQLVQGETSNYLKHIFIQIEEIWPLFEVGCINEVLCALRRWKEQLASFITESPLSADDILFSLQYIQVVKLLGNAWLQLMSPRKFYSNGMGELAVKFGKLDRSLTELMYRFVWLTRIEEMHILELMLVTCVLRLSSFDAYGHESALRKLYSTMVRVDSLHKDGSIELSSFVVELKKSSHDISIDEDACNPFLFSKLARFFTLKQFPFSGKLKHIKAELQVKSNGNPLPFVPGMPVGIPLQITLFNTLTENRLWVKLALADNIAEFVFVDLNEYSRSDETWEFAFTAPFYRTPKAKSFMLNVCIGMECLSENFCSFKGCRGPKRDLIYLCKDKEVYLSLVHK